MNVLSTCNLREKYGVSLEETFPAKLEKMPGLKWIHVMQSGINNLPFEELAEQGIQVTNAKGINPEPIAEYLMGMMLNLIRKTFVFYEAQKRMEWDTETRLDELAGKTLGIIGLGRIGKELAAMKTTAYLLHVSRGGVIDQEALIRALRERSIVVAVLDVFSQEPLPSGHPYWSMDNVLVTPHIAGDHFPAYTPRAMAVLMDNLRIFQKQPGGMCNIVNLASRY